LGLHRSGLYYQAGAESAENLRLMNLLVEQYTRTPFYGVRRMTAWLRGQGYEVNEKRVQRLLRQMGLGAIYPKPRLSQKAAGAPVTKPVSAGCPAQVVTNLSGEEGWRAKQTKDKPQDAIVKGIYWHARRILCRQWL